MDLSSKLHVHLAHLHKRRFRCGIKNRSRDQDALSVVMMKCSASTINYTSSGSELCRTEQSIFKMPRFFPVPPSVLHLLNRGSKSILFIHSLANRTYPRMVAGALVGKHLDERISSIICSMRGSTNLTP